MLACVPHIAEDFLGTARDDVVTLTVEQALAQRNVFRGHTSHKPGKPSGMPTVLLKPSEAR